MDSQSDNPIVRFSALVWGLGIFLLFAVALGVIWLFNREEPKNLEEIAASARYSRIAEVEEAQRQNLPPEAIAAAIPEVARQLAASKPTPGRATRPGGPRLADR